ncbi:MAG: arginine--tRNA ligase [Chitinophagaceae bacterium]|nr:arginine--tRNA ligase [Chitinophagaceae bacterium]
MSIVSDIKKMVATSFQKLYNLEVDAANLTINQTKPEFEGDYTLVLFSFLKQLKTSPDKLGNEIGEALVNDFGEIFTAHNTIKGFLNLTISDDYWLRFLQENFKNKKYGTAPANHQKVMVEYSSPNTNKPIHLGHLRNNFLGWSVAEILKNIGYDTIKCSIVNDRGIHICKSMIAWQLFAKGATPESTGIKGDHFVGDYYVKFNEEYKSQVSELVKKGMPEKEAEREAPIMKATQKMLLDWEAGEPEVMELWEKMNQWVYDGFDVTYKRIGSDFDKTYYESQTYLLGKKFVEEGLQKNIFFRKDDGSVWIDLTEKGLDEKLVLRKDGTSVYMTQDLGLAEEKYKDYHYNKSIYVIADEQNYHMKVLQLILQEAGKPYADGIEHLSYGLVELPSGKMKSREGTVVDADDIIDEMVAVAKNKTKELGKVNDFEPAELAELYDTIALGALKFFLLRVDPKKKMVFNPEESIDFHGFTGPFIQYTHARIKSILRKENPEGDSLKDVLLKPEKDLLLQLEQYPSIVEQAAAEHNPSVLAIYIFQVAKSFNSFYAELSIMKAESKLKKELRLQIASLTARVIASGMHLLGIKVPERM